MRLFSALLPPAPAVSELAATVAELRALPGADRLRWTQRAGWHFTLAFYGEVPDELVPRLSERLGRAARRHRPLTLRLTGGGRFGDRTLWAGAEGDLQAVARLAATAAAAGRRAGIPVEEHLRYTPHLTLARGRGVDLRPFAARLAGFAGTEEWTVGELALIRSHPPAPGVAGAQPHYEPLTVRPLGRAATDAAGGAAGDGAGDG
ncbi:RNA 2',3'-cyclic phosphodiesterase [Streptomyces sp. NPDC048845]|uniref:RNA 2',3'-cyclic phosphodiesterase n=1 Tax=Streptomyces sp. NPDC048845 TaxID=3155390 RepID=UPI003432337E